MRRCLEDDADRVESNWTGICVSKRFACQGKGDLPNHALELLLLNVVRYFALDISSRQCHCERF